MCFEMSGKAVIFSAPSGSGKTTIVRHLLGKTNLPLGFSISATTRSSRGKEEHGKDYFFLKVPAFKECISKGELIEWEEVYEGVFYGTLRTELERLWSEGKTVLFDVDVVGGLKLREALGDRALSVFVQPPSLEELQNRLEGRGTDTKERIHERMEKAEWEWKQNIHFDQILINTNLDEAFKEAADLVTEHLGLTPDPLNIPKG
jgi:guanylate kinase